MAFAVRNASSALAEMNITPLVDVMLVLLVIFMVTAPMLDQRMSLTLPGPTPPRPEKLEPLRLLVEAGDMYRLGEQTLSLTQLQQALRAQRALEPQTSLAVRIHPDAEYQSVVAALASADQVGIEAVGLEGR